MGSCCSSDSSGGGGSGSNDDKTVYIKIKDKAPGWAAGTIGGGSNLDKAITVSNMDQLEYAIKGDGSKIVLVKPGHYEGTLEPGSNTTIIGTKPGVMIEGNIKISGSDKSNIIIRNLAVRSLECDSYNECKHGGDAVYIGNDAHHVWLDHLDISDGQDGNFDYTRAGNFVTCSWCKFYYTYDKEHNKSTLIAGSDEETQSRGKLKITFMNCMWGDGIGSRQPRGRFGKVHMINNYHDNRGSLYGVGKEMSIIVEGCYYDVPGRDVFFTMGGEHIGWKGINNEGSARNMNDSEGRVFEIPYKYTVTSASTAKSQILKKNGGAGNTCSLKM